jgi:glucuronate isomerase
MEKGLLPNDEALVGKMVRDICFGNANRYFALPERVTAGATR